MNIIERINWYELRIAKLEKEASVLLPSLAKRVLLNLIKRYYISLEYLLIELITIQQEEIRLSKLN